MTAVAGTQLGVAGSTGVVGIGAPGTEAGFGEGTPALEAVAGMEVDTGVETGVGTEVEESAARCCRMRDSAVGIILIYNILSLSRC